MITKSPLPKKKKKKLNIGNKTCQVNIRSTRKCSPIMPSILKLQVCHAPVIKMN